MVGVSTLSEMCVDCRQSNIYFCFLNSTFFVRRKYRIKYQYYYSKRPKSTYTRSREFENFLKNSYELVDIKIVYSRFLWNKKMVFKSYKCRSMKEFTVNIHLCRLILVFVMCVCFVNCARIVGYLYLASRICKQSAVQSYIQCIHIQCQTNNIPLYTKYFKMIIFLYYY